jgi:hypothetical protein
VPFVLIQIVMVCLVIAFPQLVNVGLDKTQKMDIDKVQIDIPNETSPGVQKELEGSVPAADESAPAGDAGNDDIMKSFGGAK